MKAVAIVILLIVSHTLVGQTGYVKVIEKDTTIVGFLRITTSFMDGNSVIEVWKAKKDKNPLKFSKREIYEYAIRKDTFKVLHQFQPFHDSKTYFELVDARLKSKGKINLYVIESYQNPKRISTYTGGGIIPYLIDESSHQFSYIYILEDKVSGYLQALPSKQEKLNEVLIDFFPERYIVRYGEEKGEITYKSIPALVALYNSK